MVKVIMGKRGSGKTKQVIDMVNVAVNEEAGNVVCVEKGTHLRFNIKYSAKLVDVSEFGMELSYENLYAFLCGMYSGNYDITQIFVDNFYKIIDTNDDALVAEVLGWLEAFSNANGVTITLSLSGDAEKASDALKKYFI